MSIKKIKIEGVAEFGGSELVCVCAYCNYHARENATIEYNFKEKKVFYHCPECKKMNEMFFGQNPPPPLPRTRM